MYLYIYIERERHPGVDIIWTVWKNISSTWTYDLTMTYSVYVLHYYCSLNPTYILYIYMYVYIIYIESHWVPLNFIVSPLYHHCCFFIFLFRLVKSLFTILITKCMCIYIYIIIYIYMSIIPSIYVPWYMHLLLVCKSPIISHFGSLKSGFI